MLDAPREFAGDTYLTISPLVRVAAMFQSQYGSAVDLAPNLLKIVRFCATPLAPSG